MKKTIYFAMFAAAFCATMSGLKADEIDMARVLGHGQSCDHVIKLVLRHGVNNPIDRSTKKLIHNAGYGPMFIPAADIGDLELLQVTALLHRDQACGPKFAIVIRNQSTREVCGLRISAVGLLGRIRSTSPTAVVKVDKICAGESMEVIVQMPVEALSMGNHNGTVVGFRRLLVAIDSFDQFIESNESNNVKVFDLASLPVQTTEISPAESVEVSAVEQVQAAEQFAAPVSTATVHTQAPAQNELQSAMQKLTDANSVSASL